ncbi:siderophore-interacting protein [Affinibrenneria salicis]|uniref:Siderophore-interacting protein n=1 Tax=Affinibrenneria salicis TaxID=2590031 RepID=A0A5J5FV54_9GAMM|nr:siderophore-interacting protein [Affinibrenneria salicis]KAA8996667.1 siderophore-interacting protein [Affinibrenneria salicis]
MTTSTTQYPARVRNELRFRAVTVTRSERVSGGFQRLVFSGADLQGFETRGFDDHIKLFFPASQDAALPALTDEGIVWPDGARPPARDYTPLFDAARNELAIDFYLHQQGVASDWARTARAGDKLIIGGPRASLVVPEAYGWQLYICDETGLPALKRRLDALQRHGGAMQVTALVMLNDASDKDYLAGQGAFQPEWFVQDGTDSAERRLFGRLDQLKLPAQDYFLWVTGEGERVKRIGDYLTAQGAGDAQLLRAVAYWHHKAHQEVSLNLLHTKK